MNYCSICSAISKAGFHFHAYTYLNWVVPNEYHLFIFSQIEFKCVKGLKETTKFSPILAGDKILKLLN